MAKKNVWLGSVGPFVFDDSKHFGLKTDGPIEICDVTGDIKFFGASAGLIYGTCAGKNMSWIQNGAIQNRWYPIVDSDMTLGYFHNVTHDGSGKITVKFEGHYFVTWSLSGEVNVASAYFQAGILINKTMSDISLQYMKAARANDHFSVSGSGIVGLAANNYIQIAIRTTDARGPNLGIDHSNFSLLQVGGL